MQLQQKDIGQLSRTFVFASVVLILLLVIVSLTPERFNFQVDERFYKKAVDLWNTHGIDGLKIANENKPLPFLYVQKLLGADIPSTRLLNILLIWACSMLIFRLTKRYESFLFVLFPLALNGMWLTAEIFEIFFVLVALNMKNKGIGIGLATVFRPYALIYSLMVERKQWKYIVGIVGCLIVLLAYLGLLTTYLGRLFQYGAVDTFEFRGDFDIVVWMVWLMMMYCGWNNKTMRYYGLLGSIPIGLRIFTHYFYPSITWFFVGYLLDKKENSP